MDKNGEKADNPSAIIQVTKAEWDKLQNDAKRVAKEQTPDQPLSKREAASKSGKSAKALKFDYDEAPDDTSTADSAATSRAHGPKRERTRPGIALKTETKRLRDSNRTHGVLTAWITAQRSGAIADLTFPPPSGLR